MRQLKSNEQLAINRATATKEQMFIAKQDNDVKVRLYEILEISEADFKEELRNIMFGDEDQEKGSNQTMEEIEMDDQTKEIIIKHVLQLTDIMNETTDEQTKKRLDRQIEELKKDFNLN